MTRINTNVSSLIAQTNLAKSNNDLQTALNRLSTGLRINTGKDDPAGLIASENLRSDITSITKAISNTDRASAVDRTPSQFICPWVKSDQTGVQVKRFLDYEVDDG